MTTLPARLSRLALAALVAAPGLFFSCASHAGEAPVVPGFGGQSFMEEETMPKAHAAHAYREEHGLSYHIEVDGGIDHETVHIAGDNGANVMVAGSSLYGAEDMTRAITAMRG